jgi:glycosyltransferase involved in cell wall biosynthesis
MVEKAGKKIKQKIKRAIGIEGVQYYIDEVCPILDGKMMMIGWALEEDANGKYQEIDISITNQKGEPVDFSLARTLRADVNSLVCHDKTIKERFGFHLTFPQDLDSICTVKFFGKQGSRRKNLDLRSIREKWRRYKTIEDMENMADAMQQQDDEFYKQKYGKKYYQKIVKKRLFGEEVPYMAWRKYQLLDEETRKLQREMEFSYMPKISILVPAYRTPREFLVQMLDSVVNQTYGNWELCIADASLNDSIRDILEEYHGRDARIRYVLLDENAGISGNTNKAMELATGDYISLLDHDDLLAEDALYEVVKCINEEQVDVLYTDEDKVSTELDYYFDPYCKPDFNQDLLFSCNYICHFFVAKKELVDQVGWLNSDCDGSQDYDFILRCTGAVEKVGHVQKIVYHWRCHPASTAMDPESKLYCYESGEKALQNILDEKQIPAVAKRMEYYGCYEVAYPLQGTPSVLALMLNVGEFRTNYPKVQVQNLQEVNADNVYAKVFAALADAKSDYVYLGQGFQALETPGGLERLLANLQRDHVGAVGCKVISEDDKVLEAGRTTALLPEYQNIYRGHGIQDGGYNMRNFLQQDVSAMGCNGVVMETELLRKVLENILRNDKSGQTISNLLQTMGMRMIMIPMVVCRQRETFYKAEKHDISVPEKRKADPYYSRQFDEKGQPYQFGW